MIGGGATGAGIALDAASRGLKTALIEQRDFASGTSSKSTKLIHGGLRYLKQLDIGLVRESGTERAVVNKIAPHLCIPEKMLLPLIENGTFGRLSTSIGLWIYDLLANVDSDDKRVMLSRDETLQKEPLLNDTVLKGSGYYAEYRTDDARLTIELIKKAAEYGAEVANYAKATGFVYKAETINGVNCRDMLDGSTFEIRAQKVVSAGGPWVDELRKLNASIDQKRLHLSKGVHIVVPQDRLALQQSVYFDVPDGRMVFTIPRGKVTYIGTTDTTYTGALDRVVATEADRDYLLRAVNNMFPSCNLTRYDVVSNWAGLRPLIHEKGKSPSELSRKDEIFEAPDGLISIAGGKLTGYRKMAERIVDKVVRDCIFDDRQIADRSNTSDIKLTRDPFEDNAAVANAIKKISRHCKELGLDEYYGWYLVTNYGKAASEILQSLQKTGHDDLEIALAVSELNYCLDYEMVQKAEDFFVRRTGRLYFDIYSIAKIRPAIIQELSTRLNWSKERVEVEEQNLDMLLTDAMTYYESENIETLVPARV